MKRVPILAASGLLLAFVVGGLGSGCGTVSGDDDDLPPLTDGGADASDDVPILGDAKQPECRMCSDDKRTLLDCDGGVVQVCTEDEDCLGNACAPTCRSAEAKKGSVGCDYYTFYPDAYADDWGDCYAMFLVNTTNAPVGITVEYDGKSYDPANFAYVPGDTGQKTYYSQLTDGKIPPREVAILFLAATPKAPVRCPWGTNTAVTFDPARHGTGYGKAFHVTTTAPVVAYDIYPYGGGNSAVTAATLLLPTSAWDTNYVGVTAYPDTFNSGHAPWMAIVGKEDATEVTISPTADIVGGGTVPASAKGVPQTYTLNRGEVLQFVQQNELIGTPIQSTKPVGVWAGSTCMIIFNNACDAAHQQIPPVRALGHEYVAVRHADRFEGTVESPPWRFVGAVDGTKLTYVPAKPEGAPDTLESGQTVEFRTSDVFVVKSQDKDHPFYVATYMTGCLVYSPPGDCRGDPEFVNVLPPQQYLKNYKFFTDPTYPETSLVVVRAKENGVFHPVHLDCAGELTGWNDVGDYQWTRVKLVSGNFEPQGWCDNGAHEIKSDGPFGVTVWGWGSAATGGAYRAASIPGFYSQAVSYAYPAGAGVSSLSSVIVPPIPK